MSISNNLTINDNSTDLTSGSRDFFNNYFQPNFPVGQNVNTVILAQFEKITQNTESAKVLASSVIYTAMSQKIDPMTVLDRIRSMTNEESAAYLGLFLNLNRVGTSYLGLHGAPQRSKYVERMIRP